MESARIAASIALALAMGPAAQAQSLHKCTDASGQVTYSQTQCEGSERISVDAQRPRESDQARAISRAASDIALTEAIQREREIARERRRLDQAREDLYRAQGKARAADASRRAEIASSRPPPPRAKPIRTAPKSPPKPPPKRPPPPPR